MSCWFVADDLVWILWKTCKHVFPLKRFNGNCFYGMNRIEKDDLLRPSPFHCSQAGWRLAQQEKKRRNEARSGIWQAWVSSTGSSTAAITRIMKLDSSTSGCLAVLLIGHSDDRSSRSPVVVLVSLGSGFWAPGLTGKGPVELEGCCSWFCLSLHRFPGPTTNYLSSHCCLQCRHLSVARRTVVWWHSCIFITCKVFSKRGEGTDMESVWAYVYNWSKSLKESIHDHSVKSKAKIWTEYHQQTKRPPMNLLIHTIVQGGRMLLLLHNPSYWPCWLGELMGVRVQPFLESL